MPLAFSLWNCLRNMPTLKLTSIALKSSTSDSRLQRRLHQPFSLSCTHTYTCTREYRTGKTDTGATTKDICTSADSHLSIDVALPFRKQRLGKNTPPVSTGRVLPLSMRHKKLLNFSEHARNLLIGCRLTIASK